MRNHVGFFLVSIKYNDYNITSDRKIGCIRHQIFEYIRNINANGRFKATKNNVKDVLFSDAEDDRVPRFGICLSSICAPVNFTKLF